jgi:hypothetical protein
MRRRAVRFNPFALTRDDKGEQGRRKYFPTSRYDGLDMARLQARNFREISSLNLFVTAAVRCGHPHLPAFALHLNTARVFSFR